MITAEAAATLPATARLQVTAIKARRQEAELPVPDLKAARCLCTEDSLREASLATIQKISLQSISNLSRDSRMVQL
jgi:hypothetical protein